MLLDVPVQVQRGISSILKLSPDELFDFLFSGGGCINPGGKLDTSAGSFFLKWNDAGQFPGMFEAEAKGLTILRNTKTIYIPAVAGHGNVDDYQFLLLEFISQRNKGSRYWETLGTGLAAMHRFKHDECGLDHDNYIGSLPQYNRQQGSWVNFFVEQRLQPQLSLAVNSGRIDVSITKKFEHLFSKLPSLFPEENHSLLHGDLWSGNVIIHQSGDPCLIDPAVYFGQREADLAMTRLFGGFGDEFYAAYNESFPLLPGYAGRVDLYNLYPTLVHLNLFGASYLPGILSVLARFI